MRNTEELKTRLGDLHDQAQLIQSTADGEDRELTTAEEGKLEKLFAEFDKTEAQINRRQRLDAAMPSAGRGAAPNAVGTLNGPGSFNGVVTPFSAPRPPMTASLEERARWAAAFFNLSKESPRRGFATFGDFLLAVAQAPHDSRLQRMTAAAGESVGAEGGFLVPHQLLAQILGGVFVESSIVGRVSVVPMTSKTIDVAGFNRNNSQTAGAIGGISFSYASEAEALTEKTPAIVNLTLTAKKSGMWLPISNELLSDSPFVGRQLADVITEAARARLELDVIAGSGAGDPQGILNSPSAIQQAAEGGQTADTIVYENLIKMASRLHPSYWREAVWLASVATMPQLLNLQVKIKNVAGSENVGGSHYLVETDQAGNFTILGRPVLFSAACAALGDVGDIILVAPSQYALGVRNALTIETSTHERFRNDQTAFRAKMRVDGQGTWAAALTVPGAASTVSWAVTLAAR